MTDIVREPAGSEEPAPPVPPGTEPAGPSSPPETPRTPAEPPAAHASPAVSAPAEPERRPALSLLVDVLAAPVAAFRYLSKQRHVGLALLVAVVSSLTFSAAPVAYFPLEDAAVLPVQTSWLSEAIAAVVVLLIGAGIYHVIARLLGGRNSYVFMLQALGFTTLPNVLAAPIYVLQRFVNVSSLVVLVNWAITAWTAVLGVIAIREVYGLSTGRAVVAYLIPVVVGLVLIVALMGLLFGALLLGV